MLTAFFISAEILSLIKLYVRRIVGVTTTNYLSNLQLKNGRFSRFG